MTTPFAHSLDLPARGASRRVTRRLDLQPRERRVLFDETGPGCVLHWWLTYGQQKIGAEKLDKSHILRLRVFYDTASTPAIDMPLARFFGGMLGKAPPRMRSAALKRLPANALTCYMPMPFHAMRIELINESDVNVGLWAMFNWHAYHDNDAQTLTPMRLHVHDTSARPAERRGSLRLADLAGRGFIAGFIKAVHVRDTSDSWYHTGGDLWLLDGETAPHLLHGIGGEDIFNMSFGLHPVQDAWTGTLFRSDDGKDAFDADFEVAAYRFFGPDPVWFDTSAVLRFGTKGNDIETVTFAYLDPAPAPQRITPAQWRLAGPFECTGDEQFETETWADQPVEQWPTEHRAEFGQYRTDDGPAAFTIPIVTESEHGWCDMARHFRTPRNTNTGTQPTDVLGHAVGAVHIERAGRHRLRLGYDDRLKLWINDELVHASHHDAGFASETLELDLPAGEHMLRVKLSNHDNQQWRAWAFALTLEST